MSIATTAHALYAMIRDPNETYWRGTGRFQAAADALGKLVPKEGACPDPQGRNKHLDRYRRAVNCYYDLFNNGLCNRGAEFRALFRVGALPRRGYHPKGIDFAKVDAEGKVEAVMDKLVLAAAREQSIEVR